MDGFEKGLTLGQYAKVERIDIFIEIAKERELQDEEWGGIEHDVEHDAFDWCGFIRKQLGKVNTEATIEKGAHTFRERMVKVAALAVAAIEARDELKLRIQEQEEP